MKTAALQPRRGVRRSLQPNRQGNAVGTLETSRHVTLIENQPSRSRPRQSDVPAFSNRREHGPVAAAGPETAGARAKRRAELLGECPTVDPASRSSSSIELFGRSVAAMTSRTRDSWPSASGTGSAGARRSTDQQTANVTTSSSADVSKSHWFQTPAAPLAGRRAGSNTDVRRGQ